MQTAKALQRVSKAIKRDGIHPIWGVNVTAGGNFSRFIVQRYYTCIHGWNGYRIFDAGGRTIVGEFPRTVKECAERLIELTAKGN